MLKLRGKIIRLHSNTQPERFKLYYVTTDQYDGLANGRVRESTVNEWIDNGLTITVYDEIGKFGGDYS